MIACYAKLHAKAFRCYERQRPTLEVCSPAPDCLNMCRWPLSTASYCLCATRRARRGQTTQHFHKNGYSITGKLSTGVVESYCRRCCRITLQLFENPVLSRSWGLQPVAVNWRVWSSNGISRCLILSSKVLNTNVEFEHRKY